MAAEQITGWTRTAVLGVGALAGVLLTAEILHLLKGGAGPYAGVR